MRKPKKKKKCRSLRARLMRQWKGTPLEVKTSCQMQTTYPIKLTFGPIHSNTGSASVVTNRFSGTFSTL